MQDGKSPDVAAFAFAVAIALGRTHSGIAGEVVGDKTVRLEPVGHPGRLITVRGGILDDRFPGNPLQRSSC